MNRYVAGNVWEMRDCFPDDASFTLILSGGSCFSAHHNSPRTLQDPSKTSNTAAGSRRMPAPNIAVSGRHKVFEFCKGPSTSVISHVRYQSMSSAGGGCSGPKGRRRDTPGARTT